MTNQLLSQLLFRTELTTIQKEIVEQYLLDVMVEERLEKQKNYIKTVISDEIGNMLPEEMMNILKSYLV
jgi:hypothetical protein